MKMRLIVATWVVVLISGLCSASFAQYQTSDKSRLGVRMQAFRPSGKELRDIGGTWFGPAFDIHLTYDKLDRPSTIFTLGWFGETTSTASAKFVPVTLSYVKHIGESTQSSWYFGGGLGAYFTNYETPDMVVGSTFFPAAKSRGTVYGVTTFAGREFGGAWFAEVRYDKIGELSQTGGGIDFSGLTLSFGSRLAF